MASKEEVIAALKQVYDPELFLDVWFMGLIYKIDLIGDSVKIQMTLTSPLCPMGPTIIEDIKKKLLNLAGICHVEVQVVFDPPWEPSDDVKGLLGML